MEISMNLKAKTALHSRTFGPILKDVNGCQQIDPQILQRSPTCDVSNGSLQSLPKIKLAKLANKGLEL